MRAIRGDDITINDIRDRLLLFFFFSREFDLKMVKIYFQIGEDRYFRYSIIEFFDQEKRSHKDVIEI